MAPAAQNKRAGTSIGGKPKPQPSALTVSRSVFVMSAGVTPVGRPPVDEYTHASG